MMFVAAFVAASQGSQPSAITLQLSAKGDPFVFAMMLADASIPSGIVIRESTLQRPRGRPDFASAPLLGVATDELAKFFNDYHQQYRATLLGDVLVISGADGLPAYLTRDTSVGRTEIIGIMTATRRVIAGTDSKNVDAGGTIGSSINADSDQRGDSKRIVFDGTQRRVIDGLNAIARQAKSTWIAVTNDTDKESVILKIGFIHRAGSTTLIDVRE
jgi:hypothetical protein